MACNYLRSSYGQFNGGGAGRGTVRINLLVEAAPVSNINVNRTSMLTCATINADCKRANPYQRVCSGKALPKATPARPCRMRASRCVVNTALIAMPGYVTGREGRLLRTELGMRGWQARAAGEHPHGRTKCGELHTGRAEFSVPTRLRVENYSIYTRKTWFCI